MTKAPAAGQDLGGRRQPFAAFPFRHVVRLLEVGELAHQVARELGMSGAALDRRIRDLSVFRSRS